MMDALAYVKTGVLLSLMLVGVGIAAVAGWVINILEVFGSNFSVITGELVLRVVGIFIPPIGAVMGYV